MKQPYAKLISAMWSEDSDFRTLPALAQRAYMVVISQPNISNCGVVPLAVKRWAGLAPDTEPADIERALAVLSAERYIVVSEATDELWVRSWMKYDGLMAIHNGPKGIARSIEAVLSGSLKRTVRSAAYVIAPQAHRSLFEPPHQPPPQGGSNYSSSSSNDYNYDNDSSSAGAPDAGTDGEPVETDAALAAALGHALDLRRAHTKDIRNPTAWERGAATGIARDYTISIQAFLAAGETPLEAATHALGYSTTSAAAPAWHANPHCQLCDGTGLARDEDERFGPCECRRSEPYLATVHQLREGA